MESIILEYVGYLRLIIEIIGAVFVGIGCIIALYRYIKGLLLNNLDFTETRLVLARYLALALELQLGADILSTAVAPSWDSIGKLGAIAVIRTLLNYFLSKEMEREEVRVSEAANTKSNP